MQIRIFLAGTLGPVNFLNQRAVGTRILSSDSPATSRLEGPGVTTDASLPMTPAIAWLPTDDRVARFEACFPADDGKMILPWERMNLLELQNRDQRLRIHWS